MARPSISQKPLLIRFPPAQRFALEQASITDVRSCAEIVREAVADWLTRRERRSS